MPRLVNNLVDRIARRERGRLITNLVHRMGSQHLALAEDVAQDALLQALSIWPYRGPPDNPPAWLYRVAFNKALDRLRHENRELVYEGAKDFRSWSDPDTGSADEISDPELLTIFLCCHPLVQGVDQLALTLRIVTGFTAKEIASLFFTTEAAMSQRLSRSKRKLGKARVDLSPEALLPDIESRLAVVLKVIYLIFSLGYAPGTGTQLVRSDVAREALRLATELARQKLTATPTAQALAALLSFQASRLDAREDEAGKPILFRDQDRARWNKELIDQGMLYLQSAANGKEISRYHLEAGIASVYATAGSWQQIDWEAILRNYAHLQQITQSPVVTVNRCVAEAFSGQPERALQCLSQLDDDAMLIDYAPFHIAKAEVLRLLDRPFEAKQSYDAAIKSRASGPVIKFLEQRLQSEPFESLDRS